MFYRFNAHRESRQTPGSDREAGMARDQAARHIVEAILRVQRRWSDLMRRSAAKLSPTALRISISVCLLAAAIFALSLIVGPPSVGMDSIFGGGWYKSPGQAAIGYDADSLLRPKTVDSIFSNKP